MYLGIEIGGTKLQAALGDGLGTVHQLHRVAARPEAGAVGIRAQILQSCSELLRSADLKKGDIKCCGIGFGGPVDDRTGNTIISHQVSGWEQFPLAEWAAQELGTPVVIGNDADVAGLAEATIGAGRGCNPVFYMNVGSGIGGALILDGKIHRGTGVGAGEIGHVWVDYELDGPGFEQCQAVKPDLRGWSILEHRSSGWALQKSTKLASVTELIKAIQAGDRLAEEVWVGARRRVALALSHVIALVCPERIVIGGGVSLAPDEVFLGPLREEVARIVFRPFSQCYEIVTAQLGEAVVVHGALALAKQRFNK